MSEATYQRRRGELKTYFDATALKAWTAMTSDAPLSKIRATVRMGRDRMRAILLSYLPQNLIGRRVLAAGCGPGQLSWEAAARGADVLGVDLSPKLIALAEERRPKTDNSARVRFASGDMLDPQHGVFDHVVAMDSLIHYGLEDLVGALAALTPRARRSIVFTLAPRTPALSVMHAVGSVFPRADRAPAIRPVRLKALIRVIERSPDFAGWSVERTERVQAGFYTSQAVELARQ
ncbi:MAG: magnesium protoporphyrin IX methyltransferase [Maricaulaceae bacterium]